MKKLLLASSALIALTAAASAADLPAVQPYAAAAPVAMSWTGFNIGAHAGYSFGSSTASSLVFDTDLDGEFDDTVIAGGGNAFAPGFADDFEGGFTAGISLGYDHQFVNNFVLGAVVDLSYHDVNDSVTGFSTTPAFYTFERDLELLATARLRAGYAFDRFLVYATGGLAWAKLDHSFSTNSPAVFAGTRGNDDSAWGYTVGAGVEAMVTERISVGLEYLYTDLDADTQTARFTSGAFAPATDMRPNDDGLDLHTVRAKVAYRF